jgi:hypothetical protein
MAHPSSPPTCFTSTAWPLYVKLEFRAMTKSQRTRQRAVMISSVIARKSKTGTKPAETLDLSKAANLGPSDGRNRDHPDPFAVEEFADAAD